MVLGGCGSCAPVMADVLLLVVHRQYRHRGGLRIRREIAPDVHHCTKRDVAKIRRSPVIPDDTIWKHGKGLWVISVKLPIPRDTETSTAVGMIHEDQFPPVGVGLFDRWKLTRLGAEDFRAWFFGGCSRVYNGHTNEDRQQ